MPLTNVTTAITAATPITTPSRVSAERSLFAHNDRNAILMASVMFMAQVAGQVSGARYQASGRRHLALLLPISLAAGTLRLESHDGATGVSHVPPGGDARLSTDRSYILPEAARIESFTDTNATSNASTVQIAADPMPPWNIGGGTGGMDIESCGVVALPNCAMVTSPPTRISASAKPATSRPGRARFHGNGIGGGAAASRRTASMTETAKPDDGSISSSWERMELISASSCSVKRLIKPPSGAAQPTAAEVYCVRFPGRETISPSPCPRAGRGSAPQW